MIRLDGRGHVSRRLRLGDDLSQQVAFDVLRTMNKFTGFGKFDKVYLKEKFLYATNGHIVVRTKSSESIKMKDDSTGIDFEKFFAPKEGIEFSFEVPCLAYSEPHELNSHITTVCDVGLMKGGVVSLWSTLGESGQRESLARINLGLLRPLEMEQIKLWIRGKTDPIYFECGDFSGSIMPMRQF